MTLFTKLNITPGTELHSHAMKTNFARLSSASGRNIVSKELKQDSSKVHINNEQPFLS